MSREQILHRVRTALGRPVAAATPPAPPPLIAIREASLAEKIDWFTAALEKLNGKVYRASSREQAREHAAAILNGRSAVTSNAPFLTACGIPSLPGVVEGGSNREKLRELCATLDVGISSADYALAETGTLVMISSHEEARLVSLLPPAHLAIVPVSRLLSGLDEFYTINPVPSDRSSSTVFITGPSRTADIEQFLVRGVHGPGEIHVVLVEE